jgi:hypothetical protein
MGFLGRNGATGQDRPQDDAGFLQRTAFLAVGRNGQQRRRPMLRFAQPFDPSRTRRLVTDQPKGE